MKYVFYNLRNLAKNEKIIFAVMLVCIFSSAWIMTFSYGLYQNYSCLKIESDGESKDIVPEISAGQTLTYGDAKTYLDALPDDVISVANVIYCISSYRYSSTDETASMPVFSRFTVSGGVYRPSPYIAEMWKNEGMIASGEYLSDSDEASGEPSVLVSQRLMNDAFFREEAANFVVDDHTVMMYGKKFNIVGTHTSTGFVVPFLSVPAETPMNTIGISFENNINRKTYDILKNTADEVIPNKLKFPDLNFPDSETIYIYNNVMVISVLIAALTIINFAFLYNFIFSKRKRQLAIMRICGCTSIRAWAICLGECFTVCVPVFLIGILTYIPFMHGVLADVFEYMKDSYTPTIYAAIFIIYIVMLLVIMGIMLSSQVNKTLAESRKKEVG